MNASKSTRTVLNCEELDSRCNPAGSVTAGMTAAGNLVITGNVNSNDFTVQETAAGNFLVIGSNTTINGVVAVDFGKIHPQSVVINDSGGNNNITVTGLRIPAGLDVNTGDGSNHVVLEDDSANYISVSMAAGNDYLTTTGDIAYTGANLLGGGGHNIWVDNGIIAGKYLTYSGWSQIER